MLRGWQVGWDSFRNRLTAQGTKKRLILIDRLIDNGLTLISSENPNLLLIFPILSRITSWIFPKVCWLKAWLDIVCGWLVTPTDVIDKICNRQLRATILCCSYILFVICPRTPSHKEQKGVLVPNSVFYKISKNKVVIIIFLGYNCG